MPRPLDARRRAPDRDRPQVFLVVLGVAPDVLWQLVPRPALVVHDRQVGAHNNQPGGFDKEPRGFHLVNPAPPSGGTRAPLAPVEAPNCFWGHFRSTRHQLHRENSSAL
jgi:hypothetical protein